MNFKRSSFEVQNKDQRNLDNAKDYPTIEDLMREHRAERERKMKEYEQRIDGQD